MGLFDFLFKRKESKDATITDKNDYYNLFVCEVTKANEFFEKGTVNGRKISLEEQNKIIYNCRTYHEKYLDTLFDFTSIDGVKKIPTDKNAIPFAVSGGTPCYNLDYVLRLKATNYKKTNIELAIACLRKANEISFNANYTYEKDYMRVVEYLKDAGKFDEARQEEELIKTKYLPQNISKNNISFSQCYDKDSSFYGSDLVESSNNTFVCAECAKYTKRVFSEYGKNSKYPILPKYFKENLPEHKYCAINFYPIIEGSSSAWDHPGDIVSYSNRPFVDERTAEEKQYFESEVERRERSEALKTEFDWVREFLPELAPKSLSGYSRMKNLKSDKYLVILSAASKKGKQLI